MELILKEFGDKLTCQMKCMMTEAVEELKKTHSRSMEALKAELKNATANTNALTKEIQALRHEPHTQRVINRNTK